MRLVGLAHNKQKNDGTLNLTEVGHHPLLCANSVVIKITPDFITSDYHELQPNVHYIPASLDNITQVVEYVLDNDLEMRKVVHSANLCVKEL